MRGRRTPCTGQQVSCLNQQITSERLFMRNSIKSRIIGAWFIASLFAVLNVGAQEFRAVLTGQVTDQSGAVIRNVGITATNVDSGTLYSAKTTDKGVYYIPYVLPG